MIEFDCFKCCNDRFSFFLFVLASIIYAFEDDDNVYGKEDNFKPDQNGNG